MLVTLAAQILTGLAKGLRSHFKNQANNLLSTLLEKFKVRICVCLFVFVCLCVCLQPRVLDLTLRIRPIILCQHCLRNSRCVYVCLFVCICVFMCLFTAKGFRSHFKNQANNILSTLLQKFKVRTTHVFLCFYLLLCVFVCVYVSLCECLYLFVFLSECVCVFV